MSKNIKKIFYFNDDEEKPVTAGGAIIYKIVNNKIKLLLADTRGNYEDLGGRCDLSDRNIYSTIAREVFEESNGLLDKKLIKKRLKKTTPIYIPKSKYLVFIIRATEDESNLICSDFGDIEIHDNIKRKIKWLDLKFIESKVIFNDKLAWRLKNRKLIEKIKLEAYDIKITANFFK